MDHTLARIAVGFDMSPAGRAALEAAARLAERVKASVRVITAIGGAVHLGLLDQLKTSLKNDLEYDDGLWTESEVLTRVEQTVREAVGQIDTRGVSIEFEVGKQSPARMILDSAEGYCADMIVVGAKSGKGFHPRERLGVTAERVVRRSPSPVWVVNPKRDTFPPRTILCAVDNSETSERALGWAVQLARLVDARIIVLHVVARPELNRFFSWSFPKEVERTARRNGQETIDVMLGKFDLDGLNVSSWILYGMPDQQILNFLEDEPVELLTIGTLGRGPIGQMLLGGTAERVIRSAPCSLLAVKPDAFSVKKGP